MCKFEMLLVPWNKEIEQAVYIPSPNNKFPNYHIKLSCLQNYIVPYVIDEAVTKCKFMIVRNGYFFSKEQTRYQIISQEMLILKQ